MLKVVYIEGGQEGGALGVIVIVISVMNLSLKSRGAFFIFDLNLECDRLSAKECRVSYLCTIGPTPDEVLIGITASTFRPAKSERFKDSALTRSVCTMKCCYVVFGEVEIRRLNAYEVSEGKRIEYDHVNNIPLYLGFTGSPWF